MKVVSETLYKLLNDLKGSSIKSTVFPAIKCDESCEVLSKQEIVEILMTILTTVARNITETLKSLDPMVPEPKGFSFYLSKVSVNEVSNCISDLSVMISFAIF